MMIIDFIDYVIAIYCVDLVVVDHVAQSPGHLHLTLRTTSETSLVLFFVAVCDLMSSFSQCQTY